VLGGQMLTDVQTFVAALDTMFGGFRERADVTYALLKERSTAFVVVAAPERDALREAAYFVERLDEESMPLAGVVVNRMQTLAAGGLSMSRAAAAREALEEANAVQPPTAGLLALHESLARTANRQATLTRQFRTGRPDVPVVEVPAAARDIHDLDGLRLIGAALAG
jgi:anion-transporting  ArsA/GET3 family ATPase